MAALGKLSTQIYVSIVQATIQRKTGKFIENVEISSTAVTELPKTNGFMGQYYTLQVTIQPTDIGRTSDKTFVYFVKTLPLYNPSLVEIMRETGMADREHKTYTILMTALDGLSDGNSESSGSWHPHCYFRNEDLLVLEHLGADGYDHASNKSYFSIDQCNATLATLAKMHAASLAYEQLVLNGSSLEEKFSDLLSETSFVINNSWFVVGLETIAELVPLLPNFDKDLSAKWDRTAFMKHVDGIYQIIQPSKHHRNVLTHQDLWTSNIMFHQPTQSSSSTHAKLIDFQCMRYLPPSADVMLLLHLTTRRSHRETNFPEYLKFYYAHLSRQLFGYGLDATNLIRFEDLQASCKTLRFLALVNACTLLPWIRMPDNSVHQLKANDYEAYERIAYVRRIDYIVEQMRKDRQYQEIVEEVVCELVEWVYEQETYSKQ